MYGASCEWNFLLSRIFPALLDDGTLRLIAAYEFGETEDGRRPIDIVHPDPACRFAAIEFLIALGQLCLAPEGPAGWRKLHRTPKGAAELSDRFGTFAPHFTLFGQVRAFQDASVPADKAVPVDALMLGEPGEQTRKQNKDLWGGGIAALSVETAMLALLAAQSYSPAAGSGYRTSLTGGGPLRVIVRGDTLWETVTANILVAADWEELGCASESPESLFPWLRYSQGSLTPLDSPASHVYFACPRRIRLDEPAGEGVCDVTGRHGPVIRGMRQTNKGTSYDSTAWLHPLTPYVRRKDKGRLARFPRLAATVATGLSWRDYVGLFQDKGAATEEGTQAPIPVRDWRRERARSLGVGHVRIEAFGLKCDSAKVVGTVQATMPFHVAPDAVAPAHTIAVERVVTGAGEIAGLLRRQCLLALFDEEAAKKIDRAYAEAVEAQFWAATEPAFLAFRAELETLLSGCALNDEPAQALIAAFHGRLVRQAVEIFDARLRPLLAGDPERVLKARRTLGMFGHSTKTKSAFGLITDPQGGKKPRKRAVKETA